MSNGTAGAHLEGDGLRERKSQQNVNFVKEPESDESSSAEDEKDKKTIGRTPDGTGKYLCISCVKRNKQQGLILDRQPCAACRQDVFWRKQEKRLQYHE